MCLFRHQHLKPQNLNPFSFYDGSCVQPLRALRCRGFPFHIQCLLGLQNCSQLYTLPSLARGKISLTMFRQQMFQQQQPHLNCCKHLLVSTIRRSHWDHFQHIESHSLRQWPEQVPQNVASKTLYLILHRSFDELKF